MILFDSHCHIDVEAFDRDREQVLEAARAAGVRDILVPAVRRSTWPALLELCARDPHLYPALGLHPVFLPYHRHDDVAALAAMVAAHRPVAIGEIGLDFHVAGLDRAQQQALLEAQLSVAAASGLPAVLHVRKAHDRMLGTLHRFNLTGGICHAFNGSLQQADRYLALGFRLGFGGMLTYPRSNRLRRLAVELPLDAIVLETDAPDMTGAAHRYQRNSPAYLPEVVAVLADLRGLPEAEIAIRTSDNARAALGLDRAAPASAQV